MTMNVIEHKIVSEVKHHPNDVRYPCRSTHEIIDAGRKLITNLSISERQQMLAGELVIDEEETAEFYDQIEVKDVIGLGIFRDVTANIPGFSSNMYSVEEIHKGDDYMECKNFYTKEIEDISFQDISIGLALNLSEILYRDDKPFGAPNEQEWTIKIQAPEDDEDAKKEAEKILENLQKQSSGEKLEASSIEKELAFPECYHSFDYLSDTYCVILNSKEYWDSEDEEKEMVSVKHLADKLGFIPFEGFEDKNAYLYEHKYSTTDLRMLFVSFKCEENKSMNSN